PARRSRAPVLASVPETVADKTAEPGAAAVTVHVHETEPPADRVMGGPEGPLSVIAPVPVQDNTGTASPVSAAWPVFVTVMTTGMDRPRSSTEADRASAAARVAGVSTATVRIAATTKGTP